MDLSSWCTRKLEKTPGKLLLGGFLAGAYIGFAGQVFTLVTLPQGIPWSLRQLFGGLVFSVGLIMVVLGKADLFTGNCLLVAHCFKKKAPLRRVLLNWALVYGGNFLGAVFLALLYAASGLPEAQGGIIAERIIAIAQGKIGITFSQGFFRGILCNWLVDLAVLFAIAAGNEVGTILAIPGPIMTFVALGYEHSVANMYFLAAGILQGGSGITWGKALFQNLLPVTLGNIVGGSVLVGVLYSLFL
ncbi:formate/nitrite transporter family protein [Candidatus Caldatribacterium sp. SIUC1]|uniref:formate/nitrite transporter family protein n=1 Tax=Candidatus Caldatribacterium sp. SIUC1 TaxID=3418365 RepID=UPI003F68ED85